MIIRGYRLVLIRWWVVLRSELELVVSVVLDSRTEPALLSSSCRGDGEGSCASDDDLWVTMLLADFRAFASKVDIVLVVSDLWMSNGNVDFILRSDIQLAVCSAIDNKDCR